MTIQAVTGLPVLTRRPVTGFVTVLRMLVHSYSHFVLLLEETIKPGQRGARNSLHNTEFSVIFFM